MSNDELLKLILEHPSIRVANKGRPTGKRKDYVAFCIFHEDQKRPNLHINTRGFYCFACREKGSLRALGYHLGISRPSERGDPEGVFVYRSLSGEPVYRVMRFPLTGPPFKTFAVEHPVAGDRWERGLGGARPVLYNLPQLARRPKELVLIPEGEGKVESLSSLGLLATCNPFGASKWRSEYNEHLRGRPLVVVLADADDTGRKHAEQVAGWIVDVVDTVKRLDLPGLRPGQDVSDWLGAGHTREELLTLVQDTPVWVRPSRRDELWGAVVDSQILEVLGDLRPKASKVLLGLWRDAGPQLDTVCGTVPHRNRRACGRWSWKGRAQLVVLLGDSGFTSGCFPVTR